MSARFAAPAAVLVREVPASYLDCLRAAPVPVEPDRARAQHAGYVAALERLGLAVERLPADEACPDCCFVEDTAVVLDAGCGLLTRPGAPSRRGEPAGVAPALAARLARLVRLEDLHPDATLDGGDVLRLGDRLLVGLSQRTNEAGAAALGRLAAERGLSTSTFPVAAGLHLKSAVTLLAPGCLVLLAGALPLEPLRALGARVIEVDEPAGANVLALGRSVLVSRSAPAALARLGREPGVELVPLELDELHKGDGALTCLSLRLPAPGCWSA